MSTNHYNELGISEDANESEIKKAYRALSLKYHPDRNSSPEAVDKIQKINQAYEILSDAEEKRKYDHERKYGPGMGPGMGPSMGPGNPFNFGGNDVAEEFADIHNLFNMMFGNMGPGMGPSMGPGFHQMHQMPNIRIFNNGTQVRFQQRPEPLQKTVQISLKQSYQGCNIPVEVERVLIMNDVRSTELETIYITIPQGVDENEMLILKDKGHCINGEYSDLKISIQIVNETEFKRQGLDLIIHKIVTLKEALCGFSFEMNHLNGKKLCINNKSNPTVLRPQYRKVVPNLGMIREQSVGNMTIEFDVLFPESLTSEQIEGLSQLL
uniref:J domain-containing protein n=1 Tax=viral metagenome TaxID=1070528 RepID=A0A6C0I3F0_9ZZZZ